MAPPPQPPSPIKLKGLTYDEYGLTASDHRRVTHGYLEKYLLPRESPAATDPTTPPEVRGTFTNAWLLAQNRLNGIPINYKNKKSAVLEQQLKEAVMIGDTQDFPQHVKPVDSAYAKYVKKLKKWENNEKAEKMSQFNQCTTPESQAECDVHHFFAKHFLTSLHGEPNPDTTPKAMTLTGIRNMSEVEEVAQTIPGLKTARARAADIPSLILGWDQASVDYAVEAIELPQTQVNYLQIAKNNAKALSEHQEYMLKNTRARDLDNLESYTGVYLVDCPSISYACNTADELSIIIYEKDSILHAEFRFAPFEGVMLLHFSTNAIRKHLDGSTDESDVDPRHDSGCEHLVPTKGKRKASIELPYRTKPSAHSPSVTIRRLSLLWRGIWRETGELLEDDDEEPSHIGFLEFLDDSLTAFRGTANLEMVGKNVRFEGLKVDGVGTWRPYVSWDDYAE